MSRSRESCRAGPRSRWARNRESRRDAANEQQHHTAEHETAGDVIWHREEEKHRQAAENEADGGPYGYRPRAPQCDTDQCRAEHGTRAEHCSVEGHDAMAVPPLSQVHGLSACAHAGNVVIKSVLADIQGE